MPKYEVEIIQMETYLLEVDAEDECQAAEIARVKMKSDGKEEYHFDSDAKTKVVRL